MDDTPLIEEEVKLPLKLRLSYSVGHVLNDICASMWFTYLLVFFHLVLEWPPEMAGVVMLIGQVADGLSTPFVGLEADRVSDSWFYRYGRRKIWHLVGTLCVILSFPFVFSPCIDCKNAHIGAQLVYYSAFICIFQFGWAAVQISHLSLIPDLTAYAHERTGLIANRYTFTVISNVLVFCITWAVLHVSNCDAPIGPKDVDKFQMVVFIGLGVGIVCSILFHVGVKEKSTHQTKDREEDSSSSVKSDGSQSVNQQTVRSHQKTAGDHLRSATFYKVAGVFMATRLFTNLTQVYIPLYLHELRLGAQNLAIVPLVMFLSSFATSFIVKPINNYCGRKVAYLSGCLIGLGTSVWVWYGAGAIYTTYEVYVVGALIGVSSSILLITSLGLTADLIGINTGSGAFVYGAMSFVDKLSNGMAVGILQKYMQCYELNMKDCYFVCEELMPSFEPCSRENYRNVLSLVCGGSIILGLLCLLTLVGSCRRPNTGTSENEGTNAEGTDVSPELTTA